MLPCAMNTKTPLRAGTSCLDAAPAATEDTAIERAGRATFTSNNLPAEPRVQTSPLSKRSSRCEPMRSVIAMAASVGV